MGKVNFEIDSGKLNSDNFLKLVNKVWPGKYDKSKIEGALIKTKNICAWNDESKLMEMVFEISPSSLSFGVQPGNGAFFTKIGYNKGLDSYQKKKHRN